MSTVDEDFWSVYKDESHQVAQKCFLVYNIYPLTLMFTRIVTFFDIPGGLWLPSVLDIVASFVFQFQSGSPLIRRI